MREIGKIQCRIDDKLGEITEIINEGFYVEDYLNFCNRIEKITEEIEGDVQKIVSRAAEKQREIDQK